MKLFLLFIITTQLAFCQNDTLKTKKIVVFKEEFSIYGFRVNHFGENFLSKANKPQNMGIGTQLVLFRIYNIGIGAGGEFLSYRVIDKGLGGNIERSNVKRLFGKLLYYIDVNNEVRIEPLIGYDKSNIQQRSGGNKFGLQEGNSYILGVNATYRFDKTLSAFIGLEYLNSQYEVITNPEFESFFNQSKQLNLKLGIVLH